MKQTQFYKEYNFFLYKVRTLICFQVCKYGRNTCPCPEPSFMRQFRIKCFLFKPKFLDSLPQFHMNLRNSYCWKSFSLSFFFFFAGTKEIFCVWMYHVFLSTSIFKHINLQILSKHKLKKICLYFAAWLSSTTLCLCFVKQNIFYIFYICIFQHSASLSPHTHTHTHTRTHACTHARTHTHTHTHKA